jgi:methyltransferase-like protein
VKQGGSAYEVLLRQEVESLRRSGDSYLYHEHLEEVNDPIYFHEFVKRAEERGLQYLGDSHVPSMILSNVSAEVKTTLKFLTGDQIQAEQYLDFLRNRTFRETLLCRKGSQVNWGVEPDPVRRMHIASGAIPFPEAVDLVAKEPTVYQTPGRAATETNDPIVRAALACLREAWPQAIPFSRLRELVHDRLEEKRGKSAGGDLASALAARLLSRYLRTDLIELHTCPLPFTTTVSDQPLASPLARLQAETASMITNRRHEMVNLKPLERFALRQLDGQTTHSVLLERLVQAVNDGILAIHRNDEPLEDPTEVRDFLNGNLEGCLNQLARVALLVG